MKRRNLVGLLGKWKKIVASSVVGNSKP
jgi:hypothetical protein